MTSEFQPRTKNGQPAQRTTGVASTSCTQFESGLAQERAEAGEIAAHLEREHREREDQPDPEPAGHVGELGIGTGFGGCQDRLQRHAANRALTGPDLTDLGVHRAGVDGAFRSLFRRCRGCGGHVGRYRFGSASNFVRQPDEQK